MHLAHTTAIPTTEIPHVVIDKEVVWLYIVSPTVQLVFSPAIPLTLHDKARYKELLHTSCVYFCHAVQLHVALQHGTHRLAVSLLVAVSCRTSGFLGLTAVYTKYSLYHTTNEVVLQGYITLLLDEFLFAYFSTIHTNVVIPLPSVGVVLVTFTVSAERIHSKPILLGLPQYLKCTVTAQRVLGCSYAVHSFMRHDSTRLM